ncbi:MAG TPA: tetratricopeptide repeat protein [Geobacteraceae bacterium]
MISSRAILVLSVLLYVGTALPAQADFEKGQEAYLMKDYAKAMEEYKNDDDPKAMYQVGYMYDHGEGVEQDAKEAAQWYLKAAEKGNAKAQYRMGLFYATGTGVDKDVKEAAKWYKKASMQGFLPAREALKRLEKSK